MRPEFRLTIPSMLFKFQTMLLLIALLFSKFSMAQIELRGSIGPSFIQGLSDLNNSLQNEQIKEMNPYSLTGGIGISYLKNYSRPFLQFSMSGVQNHDRLPETTIRLNNFGLSINYAHDILAAREQMKFEPSFGLGINYLELFVWTHDSTTTFSGILNGNQNLHYERSSISTHLISGISYSYLPAKYKGRFLFFASALYQYQIKPFSWKTSHLPLHHINTFLIQFGIGFRLRKI